MKLYLTGWFTSIRKPFLCFLPVKSIPLSCCNIPFHLFLVFPLKSTMASVFVSKAKWEPRTSLLVPSSLPCHGCFSGRMSWVGELQCHARKLRLLEAQRSQLRLAVELRQKLPSLERAGDPGMARVQSCQECAICWYMHDTCCLSLCWQQFVEEHLHAEDELDTVWGPSFWGCSQGWLEGPRAMSKQTKYSKEIIQFIQRTSTNW